MVDSVVVAWNLNHTVSQSQIPEVNDPQTPSPASAVAPPVVKQRVAPPFVSVVAPEQLFETAAGQAGVVKLPVTAVLKQPPLLLL